jgi:Flp pilus assembly pilin Flp
VFIQDGSDMTLLNRVRLLLCDESAQNAVEYGFLVLGLSLAAIATVHNAAAGIGHAYVKADRILAAAIAACMHHRPGA